jgi:hypothetical protein
MSTRYTAEEHIMQLKHHLAIQICILFVACDSQHKQSIAEIVTAFSAPTITVSPEGGSAISSMTALRLSFSEPIDRSDIRIFGTLAAECDEGTWQMGPEGLEILMLSPVDQWTIGDRRTLSITCRDSQEYTTQEDYSFSVIDNIIYVRSETGDDGNPGSQDLPVRSLQRAVGLLDDLFGYGEVRVTEGSYYLRGNSLSVVIPLVLLGGYSADWALRDPDAYTSNIIQVDSVPAVLITGVLEGVTIDGFTISADDQGIHCEDSSKVVITGNTLVPTASTRDVAGIYLSGTEAICSGNSIEGYSTLGTFRGISCLASTVVISDNNMALTNRSRDSVGVELVETDAAILCNTISLSATLEQSRLLWFKSSSGSVYNNLLIGAFGENSYAFVNDASSPVIQNNTILGGFHRENIYESNSIIYITDIGESHPIVENNIFLSDETVDSNFPGVSTIIGIYEFSSAAIPQSFRNNWMLIHNSDGGFYRDLTDNALIDSGQSMLQHLSLSGVPSDMLVDNVFAGDPYLSRIDYTPTALSPSSLKQGGLDLSERFASDIDGNSRTVPWSVGAYELD